MVGSGSDLYNVRGFAGVYGGIARDQISNYQSNDFWNGIHHLEIFQ